MSKRKSSKPAAAAAAKSTAAVTNLATTWSNGNYRSSPNSLAWNSKLADTMRGRDAVKISRFLQSKDGIPQVRYGIQQLPREAVGKGIGLKSISTTPEYRAASTRLFRDWADSPAVDLRKEANFYQLQVIWLAAMLGDGECFQLPIFDPAGLSWSLNDKSKRAFQIQTIARDQLTNGDVTTAAAKELRWIDGLQYNGLDQLQTIRLNLADAILGSQSKYRDIPARNDLGFPNVFHLKDPQRLNQYHGDPVIFSSGNDLLDVLDLKALRKHSAKVRAALLGATTTKTGQPLNALQAALSKEQTGTPAADTGRRFVEIGEGAVFIPMSDDESFQFFNNPNEAIPFKTILEDLIHPFTFELGYPPEWIFMRGKVGGTEYRGLLQQVARAHEGLRSKLYPLLQWCWEKVIGTAMMPGGPLYQFAAVPDWNQVDFVVDPDPSVDAGRDHKALMEQLGENLVTPDDLIERITGSDGEATRHASIVQKLDSIQFAIEQGKQRGIPPAIAALVGLGLRTAQSGSGLVPALAPENIAQELASLRSE